MLCCRKIYINIYTTFDIKIDVDQKKYIETVQNTSPKKWDSGTNSTFVINFLNNYSEQGLHC